MRNMRHLVSQVKGKRTGAQSAARKVGRSEMKRARESGSGVYLKLLVP